MELPTEGVLDECWEGGCFFGQDEIWNSDPGSHFTATDVLAGLRQRQIGIGMDGRGRAPDSISIEPYGVQ